MFKIKQKEIQMKGFTLVETLFGISIFIIVIFALSLFSRNVWVYNTFISTKLVETNTLRQTLKTIIAEIRTASAADTGAYTISQADIASFSFYSDIDKDGSKERVRYFLSGTELKKGVIKPTGSPATYNPLNETLSTLVTNITNSTIFNYYDKNYSGSEASLSVPIDIPSVRLVKITIVSGQSGASPITSSTQISIRNLKDNL